MIDNSDNMCKNDVVSHFEEIVIINVTTFLGLYTRASDHVFWRVEVLEPKALRHPI